MWRRRSLWHNQIRWKEAPEKDLCHIDRCGPSLDVRRLDVVDGVRRIVCHQHLRQSEEEALKREEEGWMTEQSCIPGTCCM